jgi:hypothetical protein
MALIKMGEVTIPSERLGFPAAILPSQDQVGQRFLEKLDEFDELEKDRDEWRTKAELALAKVAENQGKEKELLESKCDNFLDSAVRAFKLDKVMVPHLKDMWIGGKEKEVRKLVDSLRARAYMTAEMGLSGGNPGPSDPATEVEILATQKMASNKDLTKGEAMLAVLDENQELSARYRSNKVAGSSQKDGDR